MKREKKVGIETEAVLEEAGKLGLVLDGDQAGKLAAYLELLEKWNRLTNLVGPREWRAMFATLVVDSIHLAGFLEGLALPEAPRCLDLGAGAGLPGIPLRVLWERGEYHLVEVREKRITFLRLALGTLKLPGTFVFGGRAEDAAQKLGPADLVLSRAFMPWTELLPLARPMLAPGGRVAILANEPAPELPETWRLEAQREYDVAGKSRYFWSVLPASSSM